MKIYIDTSVIGGCFDPEFSEWSKKLFSNIQVGKGTAVLSDLTLQELESAPAPVRSIIESIPADHLIMTVLNDEARSLAQRYITQGVVTSKHLVDAQHIAIATIE